MSSHQFRFICQPVFSRIASLIYEKHIPEFSQFVTSVQIGLHNDDVWFFTHELSHCIDMVCIRNRPDRLKLQNFGWPMDKVGNWTKASVTSECNVVAIHTLLTEKFKVSDNNGYSGIDTDDFVLFLEDKRFWKSPEEHAEWISVTSAKNLINEKIELYRPNIDKMLQKTVTYIVDNCAELV